MMRDLPNFYHLLAVVPLLCLLAAQGIAALPWRPMMLVVTVASMVLNLSVLWPAVAPVTADSASVAWRWMAAHRSLPCISLMHILEPFPRGESLAAPRYAFVRDSMSLRENVLGCPATLVLPGAAPAMDRPPTLLLPSTEGPVAMYLEGHS